MAMKSMLVLSFTSRDGEVGAMVVVVVVVDLFNVS